MDSLAVVVCSSDSARDFVPVFMQFYLKNCRELNVKKIYIAGLTEPYTFEGAEILQSSLCSNEPWSSRILDSIQALREENILLVTEDILFLTKGTGSVLRGLYASFRQLDLDVLRLDNFPIPKDKSEIPEIGLVSEYSIFRISLQPSFWKRDFLTRIMVQGENVWDFEFFGSRRSVSSQKIGATFLRPVKYIEVIKKGQLIPSGLKVLARSGVSPPNKFVVRGKYPTDLSACKLMLFLLSMVSRFLPKKHTGY